MKFSMGRYAFHFTCLILACSTLLLVLVAGRAQKNIVLPGHNTRDRTGQHQYGMKSSWVACGPAIPPGVDACSSQTGWVLESDDGAKVYVIKEHCSSPLAANKKKLAQLEKSNPITEDWQIAQTEPTGEALLVELANPVRVHSQEPATSKWVYLFIEESSLVLIYGPDREHVLEYFDIHQKEVNKAGGANGA